MEKKSFRLHSLIFMSALLFMMVFHAKAEAATVIYVRKGVTGDFSFVRAPYPNSKWKVTAGKSCLKLKSSTSKKAVYYGKKVGQATLTVYNKNNPSQKYDITVYVMPSGKLNKMDFEMYGRWSFSQGMNFIDQVQKYDRIYSIISTMDGSVNKSNSGAFFQTTRTAKLLDSYKRIKMLYGKGSLKKWNASKDKWYQRNYKYSPKGSAYFKSNVKYYAQYKYGKKYGIRFFFNRKKEVTTILYLKNYP